MDVEFHYYMTYLIATGAGFNPDAALVIAHASQYVDDNSVAFVIDDGRATAYRNYISQTLDILRPKRDLLRIYPVFHFIPGDPLARTAHRKDGRMQWLNTTPNSANANAVLDAALREGDFYRIGIGCHGYVDTWAHQNFVGYFEPFNIMAGMLEERLIPNIGHAEALNAPDQPARVWTDERLIDSRIDNRQRFLEAAACLLDKLARHVDPKISETEIVFRQDQLRQDLDAAIGDRDDGNDYVPERVARYRRLAETAPYGDRALPEYDAERWMDEAVAETVRGLRDRIDIPLLSHLDLFPDRFTWKDRDRYQHTHWFRFQQAVKRHQDETLEILGAENLRHLQLERL